MTDAPMNATSTPRRRWRARLLLAAVLSLGATLCAAACDDASGGGTDRDTGTGSDTGNGDTDSDVLDVDGDGSDADTGGDTSDTGGGDADTTSDVDTGGGDTASDADTADGADVPQGPGAEGEPCATSEPACVEGLVCAVDTCVTPQGACASDVDCQSDTYCCNGGLCGADAVCIPYGTGPRGEVDLTCAIDIVIGLFDAQTQCEWAAPPAGDPYAGHVNVLTTPMVADTPHDSGAAAEILIVSYNYTDGDTPAGMGSDPNYFGVIRVLNGQTCEQLENIADPLIPIIAASPPAIGDLDNDGTVEIVTQRALGELVAFKWNAANGRYETWWVTSGSLIQGQQRWDGPSLHDLDDDGFAEVISGSEVWNGRTGARLNPGQLIPGNGAMVISVVGDVDADGAVELLASGIYQWDVLSSTWQLDYPAVPAGTHYAYADFGTPGATPAAFDATALDGIAEIVLAGGGLARIYTLDGQQIMAAGGVVGGGPPTIGDFDNDGFPEIASAGGVAYRVFDLDCATGTEPGCVSPYVRWIQPSQDSSSANTGSSIFDFEGDGKAEAVYADECFTRIYDGASGEVLFSSFRTSCTWYENAVVADPDRDSNTEILVPSNANCGVGCPEIDPIHRGLRCESNEGCLSGACDAGFCRCVDNTGCDQGHVCAPPLAGTPGAGGNTCRAYHPPGVGVTGVRVLRDRLDRWASSRAMWNQHVYTVTNVEDDGGLPRTSQWLRNYSQPGLNNFRQNVQGDTGAGVAPDITGRFDAARVCDIDNDGTISLVGQVCNRGSKPVGAAMPATFYLGDAATGSILCTSYTEGPVPVGGCLEVSCGVDSTVTGTITMVVNDDGNGGETTVECNGDNNTDQIVVENCIVN